jgi:hypothetical protein
MPFSLRAGNSVREPALKTPDPRTRGLTDLTGATYCLAGPGVKGTDEGNRYVPLRTTPGRVSDQITQQLSAMIRIAQKG